MPRNIQRETAATLDALERKWKAEMGEDIAKEGMVNIYRGRIASLLRAEDDWPDEEVTVDRRVA